MNPLADVVELPVWQFLLVYSALALFAAVFLLYVRWESCQVDPAEAAPDIAPADVEDLARGRGAGRSPEELARLVDHKLIVPPATVRRMRAIVAAVAALFLALAAFKLKLTLERGRSVVGLSIALFGTVAGALALGVPALFLTARGAAVLEKRGRAP